MGVGQLVRLRALTEQPTLLDVPPTHPRVHIHTHTRAHTHAHTMPKAIVAATTLMDPSLHSRCTLQVRVSCRVLTMPKLLAASHTVQVGQQGTITRLAGAQSATMWKSPYKHASGEATTMGGCRVKHAICTCMMQRHLASHRDLVVAGSLAW